MATVVLYIPGKRRAYTALPHSLCYTMPGSANCALAATPGCGLGAHLCSVEALDTEGLGDYPGGLPYAGAYTMVMGHLGRMRSSIPALHRPYCSGCFNYEAILQCFRSFSTPFIGRAHPESMLGTAGTMAKLNGSTLDSTSNCFKCTPSLAGGPLLHCEPMALQRRDLLVAMSQAGVKQHTSMLSYSMPAALGRVVRHWGLVILLLEATAPAKAIGVRFSAWRISCWQRWRGWSPMSLSCSTVTPCAYCSLSWCLCACGHSAVLHSHGLWHPSPAGRAEERGAGRGRRGGGERE